MCSRAGGQVRVPAQAAAYGLTGDHSRSSRSSAAAGSRSLRITANSPHPPRDAHGQGGRGPARPAGPRRARLRAPSCRRRACKPRPADIRSWVLWLARIAGFRPPKRRPSQGSKCFGEPSSRCKLSCGTSNWHGLLERSSCGHRGQCRCAVLPEPASVNCDIALGLRLGARAHLAPIGG